MKGLTAIAGIRVGHASNFDALTGCTAILCDHGATAGVDIRGSASGTEEIEVLRPDHIAQQVHGVVLSGGSAFGLETASGVRRYLEDPNGDRPDVRDGDLRERPRRRERRRVDSFSELLFREVEVLHEVNGRKNRCADADLGDVLFDLVLAVEVRNARLSVGGADGSEDEIHACCLGRVRGGDTLSCLGVPCR